MAARSIVYDKIGFMKIVIKTEVGNNFIVCSLLFLRLCVVFASRSNGSVEAETR